ncbi:tRNA (adenosine(37)-N6)-threonylcarbamoyltransferase complex transferase subunit TsaD [Patescibacteria group bacterium]|nr:tRNA (adenosine(37)-N6)-threonylcarbamoyltransferase complex transferase subunit TsaD [Patescibacteria group bacterium]
MVILGIETSCDETALCILKTDGRSETGVNLEILANNVLSQIVLHRKYGGVFPMLAKREHAKNLVPLLKKTLEKSGFLRPVKKSENLKAYGLQLKNFLEREPELLKQFLELIPTIKKPPIDLISVTIGPGLEPALWVGLNFAKALSTVWQIPLVPINHMEGHIFSSLLRRKNEFSIFNFQFLNKLNAERYTLNAPGFPALALLISGGHTQLVLMRGMDNYEVVGETLDDAVGEAFDKVARILGLPYPGGPEISRLADEARARKDSGKPTEKRKLPRPMLHSPDLNFSFSGLKTAVLYLTKKIGTVDQDIKMQIAREFEDAVTEVLITKTQKAVERFGANALILGGGVTANKHIRETFRKWTYEHSGPAFYLPTIDHSTDNALMIAIAGFFHRNSAITETSGLSEIKAVGNLQLTPHCDT